MLGDPALTGQRRLGTRRESRTRPGSEAKLDAILGDLPSSEKNGRLSSYHDRCRLIRTHARTDAAAGCDLAEVIVESIKNSQNYQ